MIEYKEYLLKTYASWLGKVIGVRLGAPVENYEHQKIIDIYKDNDDYLVDYDVFAADDDTNGPLFFARALLDDGEITPETVGKAYLNYLQEYKGFFWWGGVGVSTEHTAYENLKNGIKPPLSGSAKTNGLAISEQIGGQIFSDCWGYLALEDPSLAAKMARDASSVSHDGNGIEGGIFVAVCITLAYKLNDIHKVIDEALDYLDKDKDYYKAVKDIVDKYKSGISFDECYEYIIQNYDYPKFEGVCHIIPNTVLMVMAMCYGENDFSKTLVSLNRLGRDTDCNCGNVGSIMGALVGLKNIDPKWILPINDIVNASSCIGSLNIQTVSDSAKLFSKLAYKLHGIEIIDNDKFDLPYATNGFRGKVCVKENMLCGEGETYKYTYYLPEDIFDSRYDPAFSPVLYPGDTVKVISDDEVKVFVEDTSGNRFVGNKELTIPSSINMFIHKLGFIGETYQIKDIVFERHPTFDVDFKNLSIDGYGPRYEGDTLYNIRGFVEHSGKWSIDNGLNGKGGLISIGHLDNVYKEINVELIPTKGNGHYVVFNMKGSLNYFRLGFEDGKLVLANREETLVDYPYSIEYGKKYAISIVKDRISVNGETFAIEKGLFLGSLVGFYLKDDSEMTIDSISTI